MQVQELLITKDIHSLIESVHEREHIQSTQTPQKSITLSQQVAIPAMVNKSAGRSNGPMYTAAQSASPEISEYPQSHEWGARWIYANAV